MGLGVTTMGIPEANGGDGAGLVELALAAEEDGRLAPVPLIETTVAGRILSAVGEPDAEDWFRISRPASALHGRFAPRARRATAVGAGWCHLDAVIALCGQSLVLVGDFDPPRRVANHACAPLAWWTIIRDHPIRLPLAEGVDAELPGARAAAMEAVDRSCAGGPLGGGADSPSSTPRRATRSVSRSEAFRRFPIRWSTC